MKSMVLFCVIAGSLGQAPAARAPGQLQPPRLPPARFRSQRFELVPTTEPSAEPTTDSVGGPYPPSGWKPVGAPLALPDEQTAASGPYPPSGWTPAGKPFRLPGDGLPSTSYGTPDDVYGVPDDTFAATTTDAPATDTPEQLKVEKIEGPVEVLKSVGTYFVLLPSGQLQLVRVTGARGPAEAAGSPAEAAGSPARLQFSRRA